MRTDRGVRLVTDRELYERYGRALVAFASSLVGPPDAADVVHDAMAGLLAARGLAEADNPRALMYRAVFARAKSTQRSAIRRRRRERRFAESVVAHDPELRPDVAAAVVRLSPQQRACIYLTYWEDMAPAAVGELLSIAEGTVKRHLARARERLREVLDE